MYKRMVQSNELLWNIFVPIFAGAFVFIAIMIILQKIKFRKDVERKNDWRKLTPELLNAQIEYHNNSIYKAFELYLKLILAIIGGIAFVSVTKDKNIENLKIIVWAGGLIIYLITILFCALIITHQKAKIKRWKESFKWFEALMWSEFWFFVIPIPIAVCLNQMIVPSLIKNL